MYNFADIRVYTKDHGRLGLIPGFFWPLSANDSTYDEQVHRVLRDRADFNGWQEM